MDNILKILKDIQTDLSKQKQDMKEMEQNIKESINNNIDEKFNQIEAKTYLLETKIEKQQKTIDFLEKQLRKRNLIFFGVEEKEKGYENLLSLILDIINNKMNIPCHKWEIENVTRIGKYTGKIRPVVITTTTTSRKLDLLKKKKSLDNTGIYVKEDFPPSVLQKRRDLQESLKQERESGKRVALRYDRIVTLKPRESTFRTPTERNPHKRFMSTSPEETEATKDRSKREEPKQMQKKNKSQNITSFLRSSQLNDSNPTTPNRDVEKQQKN